jgi:hypothetical protein
MYGMGGMAKNALKNAFADKTSSNTNSQRTQNTQNRNIRPRPLGHIEKRAAARSIINIPDKPVFYIPPRIEGDQEPEDSLKDTEFSGCTFINGSIINTLLTNCTIDGNRNRLVNLPREFLNLEVTTEAIINQLQIMSVTSNLMPFITKTFNIGSNSLQWKNIYGQYLDASYGLYIGETTNGFTIERPTDSGDTNMTNSIGNLVLDNTNTTGATIVQLGTDTDATDFQVKNNSGTTLLEVNGAGEATLSGCTIIDDIKICHNQIGHATDDTDLMTLTAGVLTVAGDVIASGGAFIMTSDKRLKKQIKELEKEHPDEDLEERFNNLEPVKFKWRKQAQHHNAAKKEKYHYGLIAQNVLAEFPECAFEKPDGYLGIDYMGLTSVLILKMQKQNKLLKEKDEKIENLENNVKKQEIILNNIIQRMERLEDITENENESNGSQSSKYSSSWDKYENSILRNYKDRDRDRDRDQGGSGSGNGSSSSFSSYGMGGAIR